MNHSYHVQRVKVKVGASILVHLVIKATHNHITSKNIGKKYMDFYELSNFDLRILIENEKTFENIIYNCFTFHICTYNCIR